MAFPVASFDEISKYTCGQKCSAILEVTTVKVNSHPKNTRTVIQGRTNDGKYIAITYKDSIRIDLKPGDIVYFMDVIVGRYKSYENTHLPYDWEWKEDSKIRLLERDGVKAEKDVFPDVSVIVLTPKTTEFKKPPNVNLKKENPVPGAAKKVIPKANDDIAIGKQKGPGKRNINKMSGSKSVFSVNVGNKPKNLNIQGYVHEEFKVTKCFEGEESKEYFIGTVKKIDGDTIQVIVSNDVKLPLILKKGYFVQVGGEDTEFDNKATRQVKYDNQLIFKGLGMSEEHDEQVRNNPEPKSLLENLSLRNIVSLPPPRPNPRGVQNPFSPMARPLIQPTYPRQGHIPPVLNQPRLPNYIRDELMYRSPEFDNSENRNRAGDEWTRS